MPAASSGRDVGSLRALAGSLRATELPSWLRDALDPNAVTAELDDRIPELVPGALGLTAVRLRDARARRAWAVRFDAEVVTADGTRSIALVAERELPGARPARRDGAVLLPGLGLTVTAVQGDPALPALPVLSDPAAARSLLESALRGAGRPGLRLAAVRPRVLRHKPGHRATLLHELDYAGEADPDWPRRLVTKTYRDDDGASTYAWMLALWDSGLRRARVPRIAEPLGYLADHHTLLQRAVPGSRTLADVVADDTAARSEVEEAVGAAADGLVALHACGVTTGPARTADSELGSARRLLDRVGPSLPDGSRGAAEALLTGIAAYVGDQPSEVVPVHGAFRPAQVMLDEVRPGFLDFDGFGQGERALDVGRFLARLAELTAGRHDLAPVFVERYRSGAPLAPGRTAAWLALDLAVGAVRSWYRARPDRAAMLLGLLDDALDPTR